MVYAVLWSANDGPEYAGRLELSSGEILLSGTAPGASQARRELRCDDLLDVYVERNAPPKHTWEPALVLLTRDGERVAIGSLEGLGALHELAETVEEARGKPAI